MTVEKLEPAFVSNNLGIFFACDTNYLPYVAVTIHSIVSHADPDYNYDIVILHDGLDPTPQKLLLGMQQANLSIRFYDVRPLLATMDTSVMQMHIHGIWSVSIFYRCFIPAILSGYTKALYLDSDVLITNSLVELFQTDLGNNLVGAVFDCEHYQKTSKRFRQITTLLGLKDASTYFNAGFVMFNMPQIDIHQFKQRFFEILTTKRLLYPDQDLLNIWAEDRVCFLPLKWNYQYHILRAKPAAEFMTEITEADNDPYIIHYTTAEKPWNTPSNPHCVEWWLEARQTPFYEVILFKNTCMSPVLLRNVVHYKSLWLKYNFLKLIRPFIFGLPKRKLSALLGKLQHQVHLAKKIVHAK